MLMSVGFGFVTVVHASKRSTHFFDRDHPLERRFQTLDGRAHGLHHLVSGTVRRHSSLFIEGSAHFGTFSQPFSLLTMPFSRGALPFADFACVFRPAPEPFGVLIGFSGIDLARGNGFVRHTGSCCNLSGSITTRPPEGCSEADIDV